MPARALSALVAILMLALAPGMASAHVLSEARVGVAAHNVHFGGAGDASGPRQSNEGGASIELEIVGLAPRLLNALGAPAPYAMASANLGGDTSYAAAGLYWRWRFAQHWRLEPGFGLAVHDGARHNPYPAGDPRADDYARTHQLLGARVLFRDSLALDRACGDNRAVGIVFEHLSNGGALFNHSDNQSLNEIALRYTLRLR